MEFNQRAMAAMRILYIQCEDNRVRLCWLIAKALADHEVNKNLTLMYFSLTRSERVS